MDYEALQVAAAGATVSRHPRSGRQRLLPPPQPRHRREISCCPSRSICHLDRGHRRGDGCIITPADGRHSNRGAFRYSIAAKLTVPPRRILTASNVITIGFSYIAPYLCVFYLKILFPSEDRHNEAVNSFRRLTTFQRVFDRR